MESSVGGAKLDWIGVELVAVLRSNHLPAAQHKARQGKAGQGKGVVRLMIDNGWICIALVPVVDPTA